jgi:hypothetical protein
MLPSAHSTPASAASRGALGEASASGTRLGTEQGASASAQELALSVEVSTAPLSLWPLSVGM